MVRVQVGVNLAGDAAKLKTDFGEDTAKLSRYVDRYMYRTKYRGMASVEIFV